MKSYAVAAQKEKKRVFQVDFSSNIAFIVNLSLKKKPPMRYFRFQGKGKNNIKLLSGINLTVTFELNCFI